MTTGAENATEKTSRAFEEMAEFWKSMVQTSGDAGKAWADSIMPLLSSRMAEANPLGATQGGGIAEAIRQLVEGPKLADVWDIDRQLISLSAAWFEMRQRMASYQVIAAAPWAKTFERYNAALAAEVTDGEKRKAGWRKDFADWSAIANEEMTKNQRSEEFLAAQRDLLRAALTLRAQQQQFADTVAKSLGYPTLKDFDELTRQLAELRRELRRRVRADRDRYTNGDLA
ncbi:Poly(R)-hydroxyalkanoic acid synthase subunit (PHA_synth_III_E) [Mesorhizobium albiziae]|uniref:Poly(3-hydroxyalkanoate) polymerase subunit PhaE n=1 Tax=Neomesorhizobium albiziae TaxID=335020 RepID=A0A1I3XWV5_9HYPH|nr:poly(R)-hydroxyalkanoic acid synthase subunit PhaE [Mesorhizobium albiziae]GLS30279.1 hypothetical protein GCM10007937_19870 [Mesorhizobium albiziae]SFK23982.1 Poly(R)-hydroxyalkanoic acid synthase subunit (PHA_synth_III_E) [Mesorhizobium albiziae]